MAEFTPMASARVITATIVNPGVLTSCRKAKRKSWIIAVAFPLRCSGPQFWIQAVLFLFCSRRPVGDVSLAKLMKVGPVLATGERLQFLLAAVWPRLQKIYFAEAG